MQITKFFQYTKNFFIKIKSSPKKQKFLAKRFSYKTNFLCIFLTFEIVIIIIIKNNFFVFFLEIHKIFYIQRIVFIKIKARSKKQKFVVKVFL